MGKMHTKAERTEKVKEITAKMQEEITKLGADNKEVDTAEKEHA